MDRNNILLLGGSGFIGKNIIEYINNISTIKLTVIIRDKKKLIKNNNFNNNINLVELSNLDYTSIIDLIIKNDINCVIHLASSLKPSSGEEQFHKELDSIILPSFKLIDYLANRNIKLVYFSSGGAVYGNYAIPITENFNRKPINYYGLSKLLIENFIFFKSAISELDYIILRPSNAYGKYQNFQSDQGIIAVAIDKIYRNEPIQVWGDGNVLRDYICVTDIVNILFQLLNSGVSKEDLNVSSGYLFSINEVINTIENETQIKALVEYNRERIIDAPKIELINKKLKEFVSFNFTSLKAGIKEHTFYYKKLNES
jgi:UDP-glucose 4-epimerase